jgi:DNA-binding transcriptional ArsR family regulator
MDSKTLNALAEPNRLKIIELLRDKPLSVNEIAHYLNIRQPQSSKHLRTLQDAGLVNSHAVAQQRIYSLNAEPLFQLHRWLNEFERGWNKRLNRFDSYLNKLKKG